MMKGGDPKRDAEEELDDDEEDDEDEDDDEDDDEDEVDASLSGSYMDFDGTGGGGSAFSKRCFGGTTGGTSTVDFSASWP